MNDNIKIIKITNPVTKEQHLMDADAIAELREACKKANEADRDEVVFRAMRIDVDKAFDILEILEA